MSTIRNAAKVMNLEPWITEIIVHPEREVSVTFPVRMDDDSVKMFRGYRVQHSSVRGPHKGGIRYHWGVNIHEVRALSTWMTIKNATVNIPMGGGKGGVICNPKEMSEAELERMTRGFISKISPNIGPTKDIPAPDVYTNSKIMGWMVDEYANSTGLAKADVLGVVTGKALGEGGSLGRAEATARGGQFVLREAVKTKSVPLSTLKNATVVVQGFGNAGATVARLLHEKDGSRIIAVSDSKGGIYCESGLDPDRVMEFKETNGSVVGFPGTKEIKNGDLLEIECDVLVPSALENVITDENVDKIKAKVVLELANGPTTPEADKVLFKKGTIVIPDILANAGGVTVSYFEWDQNTQDRYFGEKEVDIKLQEIMETNAAEVFKTAKSYKVNNRIGAYVLAMSRLAENIRLDQKVNRMVEIIH